MTKLHELAEIGQSIWLDYIRRSLITSGELQGLIDLGVRGVTSNPTIFEKAIAGSADYDEDLKALVEAGRSVEEIYESMVLWDISHTADLLRPLYDATGGIDGYVSLEVSPALAYDTGRTIHDARRLFKKLARPNIMIKVPATAQGIPAVEALIADGINVNVTLLFSIPQYESVARAYISGLEKLAGSGGDVKKVASVASFFVSRVDTAVDGMLEKAGNQDLKGKIAVANARVAYALFRKFFSGESWRKLSEKGAKVQRLLWASTGTKDPAYPDTMYIDSLIGPHTVNTVPPSTLRLFMDHGHVGMSLEEDIDEARSRIDRLKGLGIDLDAITGALLVDGVSSFAGSFESLMKSIETKQDELHTQWNRVEFNLGGYARVYEDAVKELVETSIISRIWSHDHTVWKPEPDEITNRLGWLHIAEAMSAQVDTLATFTEEVRSEGYTHALLLGMGGSSLAPEVLRSIFGVKPGYLDLSVLDSTDPGAVRAYAQRLDPGKTLFIVSTKSGTTTETLSFFRYFYNLTRESLGAVKAGKHFIAITDPETPLVRLAEKYEFRKTFLNDPAIGGRYSALSYFGLVPASLIGMDLRLLLDTAMVLSENCSFANCPVRGNNHGGRLGAAIGTLATLGRDKLTFVISPEMAGFGDWVEQLIAESTGKEGKGIVPVVNETPGMPDQYGDDRTFVHMRMDGDTMYDRETDALMNAGHPLIRICLHNTYEIGALFFLWEMAIAVAGHVMGINPFDQPNVEAAKVLSRRAVDEYREKGRLPELTSLLHDKGITVYGRTDAKSLEKAFLGFLAQAGKGSYGAIQAYVTPTAQTSAALQDLRMKIRNRYCLATSLGYGPRFLHSTGQLHKGDAGKGLFIQITTDDVSDVPIPDEAGAEASSMSFGVLKTAQALGDWQALSDAGRSVIRFHLGGDDVPAAIRRIDEVLS
ncbi:MAG TPA: bifunctional transaldolase/phosoglucose isomerase [Deltaproteobacteria bacterium]|nr:bifunctional transaldolase/phosoglucose isomerase [Deltaproteobacteria bacterium]